MRVGFQRRGEEQRHDQLGRISMVHKDEIWLLAVHTGWRISINKATSPNLLPRFVKRDKCPIQIQVELPVSMRTAVVVDLRPVCFLEFFSKPKDISELDFVCI